MEPRRYVSLAYWAKDRIARIEAASNELVLDQEIEEPDGANVVRFTTEAVHIAPHLNEAA